jgi:site-specific recombinase XerC
MLAPLDPAVPRDARDGALIPVAYETQLRRSNVVTLTVQQVRWERDGTATVLIQKSKEGQEGQGCVKALSAGTARRLRRWLSIAGLTEGPPVSFYTAIQTTIPLRYPAVGSRRGPDL